MVSCESYREAPLIYTSILSRFQMVGTKYALT